jgi:hypothetical protein
VAEFHPSSSLPAGQEPAWRSRVYHERQGANFVWLCAGYLVVRSKLIGEAITQKQKNHSGTSGPSEQAYENLAEEQLRQERRREQSKSDDSEETGSSQNSQPGSGSGS